MYLKYLVLELVAIQYARKTNIRKNKLRKFLGDLHGNIEHQKETRGWKNEMVSHWKEAKFAYSTVFQVMGGR